VSWTAAPMSGSCTSGSDAPRAASKTGNRSIVAVKAAWIDLYDWVMLDQSAYMLASLRGTLPQTPLTRLESQRCRQESFISVPLSYNFAIKKSPQPRSTVPD